MDFTFEYVDSEYKAFFSTFAATATGTTDASGATIFEYPETSGSLSSTYLMSVLGGNWDAYLRGDLTYTGKTFVDEVNQSFIGDWFNLNLRTGLEGDGKRIELYVNNVFDQNQWISGRRASSLNPIAPGFRLDPTAFVIPPRKRTFGVRGTYEF